MNNAAIQHRIDIYGSDKKATLQGAGFVPLTSNSFGSSAVERSALMVISLLPCDIFQMIEFSVHRTNLPF